MDTRTIDSLITAQDAATVPAPRYAETWCSQCGADLGPGDSGTSHCRDHRGGKRVPTHDYHICSPDMAWETDVSAESPAAAIELAAEELYEWAGADAFPLRMIAQPSEEGDEMCSSTTCRVAVDRDGDFTFRAVREMTVAP